MKIVHYFHLFDGWNGKIQRMQRRGEANKIDERETQNERK